MPRSQKPLPAPFLILIDSREQHPYQFQGLISDARQGRRPITVRQEVRGLPTGDYSLEGCEAQIAVERKSAADLFHTLGQGRDRFERELVRLADLPVAAVVVEAEWSEILGLRHDLSDLIDYLEDQQEGLSSVRDEGANLVDGIPFSRWIDALRELSAGPPEFSSLNPKTVYRSVLAWQQRYPAVHWWFCVNRRHAEVTTFRVLERFWRDRDEQTQT